MTTDPRIKIVQLDAETLAALAAGDLDAAQHSSQIVLTPWLAGPDCARIWQRRAEQTLESPQDLPWVTGVIWDEELGIAVGRAGYHAAPDSDGMVEIGYGVDPTLRRRGYARAALRALIDRAHREPDVKVLRATISPTNPDSMALVHQFSFLEVGEQWDDEDGLEIIYEMPVD